MTTFGAYCQKDLATPVGSVASPGGVNVVGYLRAESGVGAAARGYVAALRAAGVPVSLVDISDLQTNRSEDRSLEPTPGGLRHGVNLICADLELHYAIVSQLGEEFFEGRYNIGVWAWELPSFPHRWHDRFAYFDEIWVASSFIADALTSVSPVPVVRIPPALAPIRKGLRERGRRLLHVSPVEFVYLFVFDFHSHFQRKNPLAVVEAFRKAFAPTDPVRLVLKCVNAGANPEDFARMESRTRGQRISIHAGYWSGQEMRDLMAACDAYVSLHRSEGTGLTITDAMALGKPVIATGWSGNMDFMAVANSYPVRYELVELEGGVGPYQAGDVWAEPSADHAAELMRQVFADRREAASRGWAARRHLEKNYSQTAVGDLIRRRLETVALRCRLPAFREEVKGRFRRYLALTERIRACVQQAVPAGAVVAVVNKGDAELLRMQGRQGWHFPQNEAGGYSGYYPADSAAAVAHLEEVRARGAAYLLFPSSAFWWLEHYGDFRRHLEARSRRVRADADSILYHLTTPAD